MNQCPMQNTLEEHQPCNLTKCHSGGKNEGFQSCQKTCSCVNELLDKNVSLKSSNLVNGMVYDDMSRRAEKSETSSSIDFKVQTRVTKNIITLRSPGRRLPKLKKVSSSKRNKRRRKKRENSLGSRDDSPSRQLVCNDLKCFAKEIEGRMSRMNLIENEITKPNPQNDDLKSSTASMHQTGQRRFSDRDSFSGSTTLSGKNHTLEMFGNQENVNGIKDGIENKGYEMDVGALKVMSKSTINRCIGHNGSYCQTQPPGVVSFYPDNADGRCSTSTSNVSVCMNALSEGGNLCSPTTGDTRSVLDCLTQYTPPSSDVSLCSDLGHDTHDILIKKELHQLQDSQESEYFAPIPSECKSTAGRSFDPVDQEPEETAISPIPSGTLHESDAYSASGLTAIQKAKKAMQNWMRGDQEFVKLKMRGQSLVSRWGALVLLVTYLRALGQPMMINNVFSGLLVLIGIAVESPPAAFGSFVGYLSSVITSIIALEMGNIEDQETQKLVEAGMLAMPAVLVGNHIGKRCCSCWFQLPEEDIETEDAISRDSLQDIDPEAQQDITTMVINWTYLLAPIFAFGVLCTIFQIAAIFHFKRINQHPLHLSYIIFAMVVFVNLQPSEESEYKGKQCYDLGRFRADVQDSDDILAYLWNSDNDTATTNLTSLRKVSNMSYSDDRRNASETASPSKAETSLSNLFEELVPSDDNFELQRSKISDRIGVPYKSLQFLKGIVFGFGRTYDCHTWTSCIFVMLATFWFSSWTLVDGVIGGSFGNLTVVHLGKGYYTNLS